MAAAADREQLLVVAAQAAIGEHQEGHTASVADILHLEKRWQRLPGSSTGAVALEHAVGLLGDEVLAGDALDLVVRQVAGGGGGGGAEAPLSSQLLSKRQFLALAHVAEVAQAKAFDLLSAEDELRSQRAAPAAASKGGHGRKRRPPTIRDAHIDSWRIAAAPGGRPQQQLQEAGAGSETDAAAADAAVAAAAIGEAEPGPLEAALPHGRLSRASSLQLLGAAPVGPLQLGAPALSRQGSFDAGGLAAAMSLPRHHHSGCLLSGGSSYVSALEHLELMDGEGELQAALEGAGETEEQEPELLGLPLGEEAEEEEPAWKMPEDDKPQSSPGGAAASAEAAAGAGAGSPPAAGLPAVPVAPNGGNALRSSWESFSSSPGADAGDPAAAELRRMQRQQQQHLAAGGESGLVAAMALAAGMTFMQHLQGSAATVAPSPFADLNPLRQAAAAAQPGTPAYDAAVAALVAASPEVLRASGAVQQQQQNPAVSRQDSGWRAFEDAADGAAPASSPRLPAAAPTAPGTLPLSARPTVQGIAGWTAMTEGDVQRCRAIYEKKGYPGVGGMERHAAMDFFARLHMPPHAFYQAWGAADLRADGRLDCREFCLFVQLLRGAQKGLPLPSALSAGEAAALLGEAPMPVAAATAAAAAGLGAVAGQQQGQQLLRIDSARLRSALSSRGGHSRQVSVAEPAESVLQDFDDSDDSEEDVGSVSGLSVASGAAASRPDGYALPPRGGPGSALGGGASSSGRAAIAALGGSLGGMHSGHSGHQHLEVAVRSAEVRYSKPLSTPIFTLSLRDGLGRLLELPVDTHPGHFRKETSIIHSSAVVRLATSLRQVPPGAVLFVEIKHWKSDKRRFSTLAWAAAALDTLVDAGPVAARVRSGPVDLPLYRKPLELDLRKAKRLTSRAAFYLHLSVRGIE